MYLVLNVLDIVKPIALWIHSKRTAKNHKPSNWMRTFDELKLKSTRDENYFKENFLVMMAYFHVKDLPLVHTDLLIKINRVTNPIIFMLCLLLYSNLLTPNLVLLLVILWLDYKMLIIQSDEDYDVLPVFLYSYIKFFHKRIVFSFF